jgi:type 1 glutamine amidotransferase
MRTVLSAALLFALSASAWPRPAAADDKPAEKPRKRILLVTHSGGFIHGSVATAEKVLKEIGPPAGFDVDCFRFTNDPDKKVKFKKKVDGKDVETEGTALEAYSARFPGGVTREQAGRLNAETLAKYDAVFFFTTGNPVETREEQAALMDFVLSGKGFVGTHCATDTLYSFKDYGAMLGGYFAGHPWHTKVTIKVEDPSHPTVAHLGASFEITDEIYQHRDPYSRENLRILASLDRDWLAAEKSRRAEQLDKTRKNLDAELAKREAAAKAKADKILADAEKKIASTDAKPDDARKIKEAAEKDAAKAMAEPAAWKKQIETAVPSHGGARKDDDYAMIWCREFGKGRVFYSALGHRDEVWKDPRFQTMLLQALRWATRGIDGAAEPSAPKKAG